MMLRDLIRNRFPAPLRRPLESMYACVPLRWRLGRDYWKFKAFLREAQWWSREAIEAWQLARLQAVFAGAYAQVPGYHALCREAGVRPGDLATLGDIQRLPLITKALLRDNIKDFTARNVNLAHCRFKTTGGSSGAPLGFYHAEINERIENACIHAGWERAGWRLGARSAVLRGSYIGAPEKVWRFDRARNELHLSSYYLSDANYAQYMAALTEYAPEFIQAYPSAISILADGILKNGHAGRLSVKAVILGSENIFAWQKDKLARAFPGARIFGFYGQTEQAVLADMCEFSDQYHVWPFYGLIEVLDRDNQPARDGVGELVGTSLWCRATPFIRYRTEDYVRRGAHFCPGCRRNFDLLETIEGRRQDYVILSDGTPATLTALIFAQHFDAFRLIRNLQLHQDRAGAVLVKIIPAGRFEDRHANEIVRKMEAAAGGRLKVQVALAEELARTPRGKHLFMVQKLDFRI